MRENIHYRTCVAETIGVLSIAFEREDRYGVANAAEIVRRYAEDNEELGIQALAEYVSDCARRAQMAAAREVYPYLCSMLAESVRKNPAA